MFQILVNATNGQIAHVASDGHVWGLRERWPLFVVLRVEKAPDLEAARNEQGRVYADLEALTDEQIAVLSIEDAVTVEDIKLSGVPITARRLETATEGRETERQLFETFCVARDALSDERARPDRFENAGLKSQAAQLRAAQVQTLQILEEAARVTHEALSAESDRVKEQAGPIVATIKQQSVQRGR
jgi:hypothetical protein